MKRRKPPKPPLGALVQKSQCETCIYRRDSVLDIKKLEVAIRDPRFPEHFIRPRACHAFIGRTVICRGFWSRHAEHCDLGQLATRLDSVYTIDETGAIMHERQREPGTEGGRASTVADGLKAARRNGLILEFACERLETCIEPSSNDHQVIIGGDDASRAAFRVRLTDRVLHNPRLAEHLESIAVAGPRAGDGSLAEFWAGALAALTRDQANIHPAILAWMLRAGPADRGATEDLQNEVLLIVERRKRKTVFIVDDLEAWNRSWSRRDEDWSLRHFLQTDPKIVLVGISATWTADNDPGRALYQGLSQSRLA